MRDDPIVAQEIGLLGGICGRLVQVFHKPTFSSTLQFWGIGLWTLWETSFGDA